MENCRICNSDFKKTFQSDHLRSVKHLEKLNQYYCKHCNTFMPISDKSNHLSSDQHKNKTIQIWCEDCGKYISDKTRHFQSEIHKARAGANAGASAVTLTPALHSFAPALTNFGQEVKVIVNEKTYIKLKVNPTSSLEKQNNDLLRTNFFPRYKYQLSYLAKFIKYGAEEIVFHKWVKSDFYYNHTNPHHTIHNSLVQKLDDEQLEGSGFRFQEIKEVLLEIYKVNDIQASLYIELPEKYKNNKSIINIKK